MQKLPVTSDPAQQMTCTLGGTAYDIFVKWNDVREVWSLDVADSVTGAVLAVGIPLLCGADVLAGFALGIGSMFCFDMSGAGIDAGDPDSGDLGTRVLVAYLTPAERPGAG